MERLTQAPSPCGFGQTWQKSIAAIVFSRSINPAAYVQGLISDLQFMQHGEAFIEALIDAAYFYLSLLLLELQVKLLR